jgi:hypothetical protein
LLYDPFIEANNRGNKMSHYSKLITEATGETNPQRVADIEESMRQDVFHSTLDWQSADQLRQGAKIAVEILSAMQA